MQRVPRVSAWKWLLLAAFFGAALVAVVWVVDFVVTPSLGTENPWPAVDETRNQADVLVLGSSHTFATVLPMEMWRARGITALDVSSSAQILPVSEQYLAQALTAQRPRVVLLEVYMIGKGSPPERVAVSRAHLALDRMPWGMPKLLAIMRSVGPGHWLELVFPVFKYGTRLMNLGSGDLHASKHSAYSYARGAAYQTGVKPLSPELVYDVTDPRAYEADLPYIRSIAKMCERSGATLVLFTAPSVHVSRVNGVPMIDRLRTDLSSDFPRVRYLDLNSENKQVGVSVKTDYKDAWHLNRAGATKASTWLAGYLEREFGLADHRSAPFAAEWNRALRRFDGALPAAR